MDKLWDFSSSPEEYEALQEERCKYFDMIKSKNNWKLPISTWIEEKNFENCNQAAIWFTGAGLEITGRHGTKILVEGPGYYATIGA